MGLDLGGLVGRDGLLAGGLLDAEDLPVGAQLVDGDREVAGDDLGVLRPGPRRTLVTEERGGAGRTGIDVRSHRVVPKLAGVPADALLVGRDLALGLGGQLFVLLAPGHRGGVLLLVAADLELFENDLLGDLGGLGLEGRDLVGANRRDEYQRRCTRRSDTQDAEEGGLGKPPPPGLAHRVLPAPRGPSDIEHEASCLVSGTVDRQGRWLARRQNRSSGGLSGSRRGAVDPGDLGVLVGEAEPLPLDAVDVDRPWR